jgi:hypothetical protein
MTFLRQHIAESSLALYATGDLPAWQQAGAWLHLRGCPACRAGVQAYRADRARRLAASAEMPPGVDWERMAAEMTANIHLGVSAGECVAPHPRERKRLTERFTLERIAPARFAPTWIWVWRPAALAAGVMLLGSAAWWLNMPSSDTQALERVMRGIVHSGRRGSFSSGMLSEEAGPVVEASPAGVQLRENGGTLGVAQSGLRPLTVSVSAQGSASAHYIDTDTGQMTITSVYAQ